MGYFVFIHGPYSFLVFFLFFILGYNPVCILNLQVLQHLMTGLMHVTFKSEDLQCSFFRYTVRELLACAVIRPVLNLANPRYLFSPIFVSFLMYAVVLILSLFLLTDLLMKELNLW